MSISMEKRPNLYNKLAPFYADYSLKRHLYLDTIDNIIIKKLMQLRSTSMLDVGTGDGRRANKIALATNIKCLFLTDPSTEMLNSFSQFPGIASFQKFNAYAEELDIVPNLGKFDVITCLWNVLGHVSSLANRQKALDNIVNLLADSGRFFLDVNNRYNIRAYGGSTIVRNIKQDLISPDEHNGDVFFNVKVGETEIPASGHVFSPQEIKNLIISAGLKIVSHHYLDYQTGKKRKTPFEGQLLFECSL